MGKRFHDTVKWDHPWFRNLSPAEKCAWDFITSRCDSVGVWIPDYESAEFYIGEAIEWDAFREKCNGNIYLMDNGKWWLVDFCAFQYAEITEESTCKPLMSYRNLLKKHNLWIPYTKGIYTSQEKEKEKEKEEDAKNKKTTHKIYGECKNVKLTDEELEKLKAKFGAYWPLVLSEFSTGKEAKGYKYKNDYAALLRWDFSRVLARPAPARGKHCPRCGSKPMGSEDYCTACAQDSIAETDDVQHWVDDE